MLSHADTAPLWRSIDQPAGIKGLVVVVGLILIGLELWWFLGRHGGGTAARGDGTGLQELTITVKGGYQPSRIQVRAGQPLRLSFHRLDPSGCLAQVIFPDLQRSVDLPLDAVTSLDLPPLEAGTYPFHCGMNMVRGVMEVVDQADGDGDGDRAP